MQQKKQQRPTTSPALRKKKNLLLLPLKPVAVERAAVQTVAPPALPPSEESKPSPKGEAKNSSKTKTERRGFISKLLGKLFGGPKIVKPKPADQKRQGGRNRSQNSRDGQGNQNRRPNNDRNRQDNRQDKRQDNRQEIVV